MSFFTLKKGYRKSYRNNNPGRTMDLTKYHISHRFITNSSIFSSKCTCRMGIEASCQLE